MERYNGWEDPAWRDYYGMNDDDNYDEQYEDLDSVNGVLYALSYAAHYKAVRIINILDIEYILDSAYAAVYLLFVGRVVKIYLKSHNLTYS